MNLFLTLSFLFFIGSVFGWVLELLFRRFFSRNNPERKWINPGFLVGPYVPLYGFGLCLLFLLARLPVVFLPGQGWRTAFRFVLMAVAMTAIEFVAGELTEKIAHVKLWDYSREWGNYRGIVCPKFSAAWAALGAAYYFLVHPHILNALEWLSRNLAFSFVVGFFFGVLCIDTVYSTRLLVKIRRLAEEYQVLVRYEELKEHIRRSRVVQKEQARFVFAFRSGTALAEHLKAYAGQAGERLASRRRK